MPTDTKPKTETTETAKAKRTHEVRPPAVRALECVDAVVIYALKRGNTPQRIINSLNELRAFVAEDCK